MSKKEEVRILIESAVERLKYRLRDHTLDSMERRVIMNMVTILEADLQTDEIFHVGQGDPGMVAHILRINFVPHSRGRIQFRDFAMAYGESFDSKGSLAIALDPGHPEYDALWGDLEENGEKHLMHGIRIFSDFSDYSNGDNLYVTTEVFQELTEDIVEILTRP
jgi:hypothetical protein